LDDFLTSYFRFSGYIYPRLSVFVSPMSSDPLFVEYVTELLAPLGYIRAKKMFGEYGLYCDEVFFALVCDSTLYFQIDSSIAKEFSELEPPYPGGKPAGKITPDLLEDHDELIRLARLSYQYKKGK